jgi:hypothetical protein
MHILLRGPHASSFAGSDPLQTTSKSTLGWITAIAFLCLFLLGLIDNLKGARLPALMIGRLIGILFADRVGYLRSILIMSLGAAATLSIGIFGPADLLTAAVTDWVTRSVGKAMGLLFACHQPWARHCWHWRWLA